MWGVVVLLVMLRPAAATHRVYLPVVWQPQTPVVMSIDPDAIRQVAARNPGQGDVILLVGDSITVDERFLPGVDPGRPAAFGGFTARDLFRSEARCRPSLLPCELALHRPGIAVVMVGTNDLRLGADPTDTTDLAAVVDACLAAGTVPILSTIPAYHRTPAVDVPTYNASVARLAIDRRVPLVDYARALEALPNQGVSDDGIHPTDEGFAVRTTTAWAAIEAVRGVLHVTPEPSRTG